MRRALCLLACVMVMVVGGAVGEGGAASSQPTLTRVRLVLTSTGDWGSLRFAGSYIRTHHVVSASPGSEVKRYSSSILIKGSSAASTTVDLVLLVPVSADPELVLAKSKAGEARATVIRTNTSPVMIADIVNEKTQGDCTITVPIARSALVGEGLLIPMLDPRRLVLAFYYPWFQTGKFSTGMWHDTPAGPYATEDPSQVAAMVNQAAGAGIQGFIFSWDAMHDRPERFGYVLDAAEQRGDFYAAPVLELLVWKQPNGSFDLNAIVDAAALALDRASHPNFLRMPDGRPVLFAFGTYPLGAAGWRAVASALSARGYEFFAVGDTTDQAFGFDGSYYYNPNGLTSTQLSNRNGAASAILRLPAQVDPARPQRLWAATVSPGQNKSYFNPLSPENEPRDNGARYDMTWRVSLATDPEWVLVTSWNEWYEATHVSPSSRYGNRALDQTRSWSSYFKNPVQVAPSQGGSQGLLPIELPWMSEARISGLR